jgi:Mu transposase, C-terminal
MVTRSIQNDGPTLVYLRYWYPIFAPWRETGRRVSVRYHPEELSRDISGELIFRTIERHRQIVRQAASETRRVRSTEASPARRSPRDIPWPEEAAARAQPSPADVDYTKTPEVVHVEVW